MGLNIKNAKTEKLVKELAELTGESLTAAIDTSVKERLARERRKGLADRLMEIGKRASALMTEAELSRVYDAVLYDTNGLPK